jgi:hypothetical protein
VARPVAARLSRRTLLAASVFLLALSGLPGTAGATVRGASDALFDATANNFQLVGHNPLGVPGLEDPTELVGRGMNAALAVHGDYAYVGSRTDGKPWGTELNLNHSGIMIIDISTPSDPTVVGEIGPPDQGMTDQTSREMRIWPEQDLLIVQNLASNCSGIIHGCYTAGEALAGTDLFAFYDISGANAADPELVAEYDPPQNPHEFFLWDDPLTPGRAVLFISGTSSGRLVAVDISGARNGEFKVLADTTRLVTTFTSPQGTVPAGNPHSLSVSNDGTRAYVSHLTGGFFVADSSEIADGVEGARFRLITPSNKRVAWEPGTPGAHSAVKVWGKNYALVTDEVYGEALRPPLFDQHGCPWGWVHMVDISDPRAPVVAGEYKLPQNEDTFCDTDVPRPFTSISAHNPTLTPNLAFISWHSGGLQAVDITDPAAPKSAGAFVPDPLPVVLQEDPVLSMGADKVVMWSYPVIKDGLIYVVDVRNGLYILRYTGPHADEVTAVDFLEGNSNLGDALGYEPVDPCTRTSPPPPPETICP